MSHRPALFVVLVAVASGAGCTGNAADRTEATAAVVVDVTAHDDGFGAPDTLSQGWTTFRLANHGAQVHAAQLVRLEDDRTLSEFVAAYDTAWRTVSARPAWAPRLGGPGAARPQGFSNATVYLEPGRYAWYCPMHHEDGVPHFLGQGTSRSFVVEPADGHERSRNAPDHTVVLRLRDYEFSLNTVLTAGRQVIRVENLGTEPHEAALAKLAPGQTADDVQAWLRNPQGPPPIGEVLGGVTALGSNAFAYFEVDLTPGEYVLLCFVTASDGRPHTEHGMVEYLRID